MNSRCDIVLPNLINRDLDRGCARTSDFSPLERPSVARTVGRTKLKEILCLRRIFQVSPRDPLHFSHRALPYASSLFPPLSRFLLSPLSRRRVLSYFVFKCPGKRYRNFPGDHARNARSQGHGACVRDDTLDFIARDVIQRFTAGYVFCPLSVAPAGQYGKCKER